MFVTAEHAHWQDPLTILHAWAAYTTLTRLIHRHSSLSERQMGRKR